MKFITKRPKHMSQEEYRDILKQQKHYAKHHPIEVEYKVKGKPGSGIEDQYLKKTVMTDHTGCGQQLVSKFIPSTYLRGANNVVTISYTKKRTKARDYKQVPVKVMVLNRKTKKREQVMRSGLPVMTSIRVTRKQD
jgi:hypothetical protein